MKKYPYSVSDVWASACAAQRINGEYVKYEVSEGMKTNRTLMRGFLKFPDTILQVDRDLGEQVQKHFKGYTFKVLQGLQLNSFEKNAMTVAEISDGMFSDYDIALICSLPATYLRDEKRLNIKKRIECASGGYVGYIRQKVELSQVEVVKSLYSKNFNTYFITCITKEDQVIYFSCKDGLNVGKFIDIKGTVKSHENNNTKLNRVTFIGE